MGFHPLGFASSNQVEKLWLPILSERGFRRNRFLLPIRIMAPSPVQTGTCCPGTGEAAVNKRRIDRLINKPSFDKLIPPSLPPRSTWRTLTGQLA